MARLFDSNGYMYLRCDKNLRVKEGCSKVTALKTVSSEAVVLKAVAKVRASVAATSAVVTAKVLQVLNNISTSSSSTITISMIKPSRTWCVLR